TPSSTLFPYTTLFRSQWLLYVMGLCMLPNVNIGANVMLRGDSGSGKSTIGTLISKVYTGADDGYGYLYDNTVSGLINNQNSADRSEEHTSELQSRFDI